MSPGDNLNNLLISGRVRFWKHDECLAFNTDVGGTCHGRPSTIRCSTTAGKVIEVFALDLQPACVGFKPTLIFAGSQY